MMCALPIMLSVMLLTDPSEVVDSEAVAAISEDADRYLNEMGKPNQNEGKTARITSVSSDYDRMAGVIMFDGNVVVQYSDDYTMCSDRLFLFLSASNEMSRVVAIGSVAITNDTRVGICDMATYRRKRGEIEMFGNGDVAKLIENGEDASEVVGNRIKFWLDSEQIEVENSRIKVNQKEGDTVL